MGRWSAVDWEVERGGERVGRRAAATTSSASSTVINFMVAVFILEGEQRRDNVGDERRTYDTGARNMI